MDQKLGRKITIGFSKGKGIKPFSKAIMWYECTDFSHVYIKINTKWNTQLIYHASGTQVNFMGIKYFEMNAVPVHEFEFDINEDDYNKLMEFCTLECGAPYSIKQVFGILVADFFKLKKNPFASKNRYVCSELVLRAFQSKFDVTNNFFDLAKTKDLYYLVKGLKNDISTL